MPEPQYRAGGRPSTPGHDGTRPCQASAEASQRPHGVLPEPSGVRPSTPAHDGTCPREASAKACHGQHIPWLDLALTYSLV